MLTWAFEFEDQPYFDGFRTLATNGIDKPILNLFRMAGLLQKRARAGRQFGCGPARYGAEIGRAGVARCRRPWPRARRESLSILVWNYHDDETPGPAAGVRLNLAALPLDISRVLVEHYRIDETHSNAYTAWKQMGSPQNPTPEQYAELEAAGQLQLLDSPRWVTVAQGASSLEFTLPRHAVSLVRISW